MGISNAFASSLWGLDYALYMAHSNFSGAMFHLGGRKSDLSRYFSSLADNPLVLSGPTVQTGPRMEK